MADERREHRQRWRPGHARGLRSAGRRGPMAGDRAIASDGYVRAFRSPLALAHQEQESARSELLRRQGSAAQPDGPRSQRPVPEVARAPPPPLVRPVSWRRLKPHRIPVQFAGAVLQRAHPLGIGFWRWRLTAIEHLHEAVQRACHDAKLCRVTRAGYDDVADSLPIRMVGHHGGSVQLRTI
jgi:hypothetical protein